MVGTQPGPVTRYRHRYRGTGTGTGVSAYSCKAVLGDHIIKCNFISPLGARPGAACSRLFDNMLSVLRALLLVTLTMTHKYVLGCCVSMARSSHLMRGNGS